MASMNIAEWTPDQVSEWLSGLEPSVAKYGPMLRERGLDGVRLLMLRCDDLEYLGMHVIGHQELLLEAVEHLRNFQYEWSRECAARLAACVAAAARGAARSVGGAGGAGGGDAPLRTQALADVAAAVRAVKPLVCWLDRWPMEEMCEVSARRAALLQQALAAAASAQRDRFAEHPARAVAAASAALAAAADYIVQEVSDPLVLAACAVGRVALRQGARPLGFGVVRSFCGHHQLADIRFGSPAHASGLLHDGDEIIQVGTRCVIGWSGASVIEECARSVRASGGALLALRLRRRAAHPAPPPRPRHLLRRRHAPAAHSIELTVRNIRPLEKPAAEAAVESADAAPESDDSEPLSPPASPSALATPPRTLFAMRGPAPARRHSVCGGSPASRLDHAALAQFWRELREERRWEPDTLYRRDKAVSYSTGLELSPRPQTYLGMLASRSGAATTAGSPSRSAAPTNVVPSRSDTVRGRLDKSHSSPAYGCEVETAIVAQVIPESPTISPADSPTILVHSAEKADQILDFKKSSSQIGEAILQQQNRRVEEEVSQDTDKERVLETINIAMMEHRRRSILEKAVEIEKAKFFPPDLKVHDDSRKITPGGEELIPSRTSRSKRAPEPPPRPVGYKLPAGRGLGPKAIGASGPGPMAGEARGPGPKTAGASGHGPGGNGTTGLSLDSSSGEPVRIPVGGVQLPIANFPVLRPVPRSPEPPPSLRMTKPLHASQISLPLRHITKHDIKMIANERREMPAINAEPVPPSSPATPTAPPTSANTDSGEGRLTISPSAAVVKSIFPNSKSRSLKKKNSILAKGRCVPARSLAGVAAAAGLVWQRVRTHRAPRWAPRHLHLAHRALYAYRTPQCLKAECMIYLEGFTVSAAGEVRSRPHAFKVYHTGTAFYFACASRDDMLAWIHLAARATLADPPRPHLQIDISKQFSETDYTDSESENEGTEKRAERDRERKEEKDKSKFGSLKKLTARMQRSESQENVGHSSTSLDRKYLRFFSRNRSKDDSKTINKTASKSPVVSGPTEQYRSYRRAAPFKHLSNPNLADASIVTPPSEAPPTAAPPTAAPPPATPRGAARSPPALLTLEEFMLNKQEEERRQTRGKIPATYGDRKLLSTSGKDGRGAESEAGGWRDSLRRNYKVHSTQPKTSNVQPANTGDRWSVAARGVQYPHLQCPPTFEPETYSLAAQQNLKSKDQVTSFKDNPKL